MRGIPSATQTATDSIIEVKKWSAHISQSVQHNCQRGINCMNGPQLPVTPKICDNVASPCCSCDNAGEEGPLNSKLCDECEKFRLWQEKECGKER